MIKLFKPEELNIDIDFLSNEDKIFFESPVLKDKTLKITYYYNLKDQSLSQKVDEVIKSTFLKFSLSDVNINAVAYTKCNEYFESIRSEFTDIDDNSFDCGELDDLYTFTFDNQLLLDSFNANPYLELMRSLCTSFENKAIKTKCKEIIINKEEFIDQLKSNAEQISENFKIVKEEKKKSEPSAEASGKKSFFRKKKEIDKNKCIKIKDISSDMDFITIQGEVFEYEFVDRDDYALLKFAVDDGEEAIRVSKFIRKNKEGQYDYDYDIENGVKLYLCGNVNLFQNIMSIKIYSYEIINEEKLDEAEEDIKRVEIGLHTKMSSQEGLISAKEYFKEAKKRGYESIGFMDKYVVQSYPEIMDAAIETGIKPLYGVEANLFDDTKSLVNNYKGDNKNTFVVFDVETTGFSAIDDRIIEMGAVKIQDGKVIDNFSEFTDPGFHIPYRITELTTIDDATVAGCPSFDELLEKFMDFCKDSVLVAHNAEFDISFIKSSMHRKGVKFDFEYIDTLELSRYLLPDLKKHKLDTLTSLFNITLENHHRAIDDATATGFVFLKLLDLLKEQGCNDLEAISKIKSQNYYNVYKISIFATNLVGLKNLYRLISLSHIDNYNRQPIVYKSQIDANREGLLIGSGTYNGPIYNACIRCEENDRLKEMMKYFDFIELQPIDQYLYLIEDESLHEMDAIKNINRRLYDNAKELDLPVLANGDVYYIDQSDSVYRSVLVFNRKNFVGSRKECNNTDHYFKTTKELLKNFPYLSAEEAKEIVIDNTLAFAEKFENFRPIPKDTFPPFIENSDKDLRDCCYNKATSIYGDPLPEIVKKRLDKELDSIIGNGYAVLYIIARKLILQSNADGYVVGSRGSVGSSFAATMSDITEVNPLIPHYVCPNCKHSEFVDDPKYDSGFDLPRKNCPVCSHEMNRDGQKIPFEVFLGFNGDKEPDIDLNFAGDYQLTAHKNTEKIFGENFVFRAGTIGTLADKTAAACILDYLEKKNKSISYLHAMFLSKRIKGSKRTTGQHAGGVMVVPKNKSILDFTPVQKPADDMRTDIITTHFDYHSISGKILKLDLLGHDVPNIIKNLEDLTNTKIEDIPFDDEKVLSLFSSTEALGINSDDLKFGVGTIAIPEFGTNFVRGMLKDTKPKTFSDLVRISGLSHGTNVWNSNAEKLVNEMNVPMSEVISTRDDIMNQLIDAGMDKSTAFKIMEFVRKGKPLIQKKIVDNETIIINYEDEIKKYPLPEWYLDSCHKISYLFPKAHAAAYVMMSYRLAWYKVYYPQAFYATYFTQKINDFDYDALVHRLENLDALVREIAQNPHPKKKDEDLLSLAEVVKEMELRNIKISSIDLDRSLATKFTVIDGEIIPPFTVIAGLGKDPANNIIRERELKEFNSIEDFQKRTQVNATVIAYLKSINFFKDMHDTNQISLF